MKNVKDINHRKKHIRTSIPSAWVNKYAHLVPNGPVLDVAAGAGRHAKFFHGLGHPVTAVDRNTLALKPQSKKNGFEVITADLETRTSVFSESGPLYKRTFSGIIAVNYLHRPLMKSLLAALRPGGTLIYDTFAIGNELFARPQNPKHLLKAGELINLVKNKLQIVAYECGKVKTEEVAVVKQRIVAINDLYLSKRQDKEPNPHYIDLIHTK